MVERTNRRNRKSHVVLFSLRMLLVVVLLATVSTAWAAPYTKLVVFGDSLSDVGNAFEATGVPASPYYQGRFSNGPIWVEDLANNLGVPSATAYLANPTVGTNFAVGGSTTASTYPNLGYTVGLYLNSVTNVADANALYVIWSGSNDFFQTIDADPTNAVTNCTANMSTWASNIAGTVSALHTAGAVNFLIPNLAPLGNTPKYNSNANKNTVNSLVSSFNSVLAADLAGLEATHGDLTIQSLDVYGLFNQMLLNPSGYGLDNVTDPAMTTSGDDSRFLFWDSVHPTAAGHALLAQAVPEPSALMLLMIGAGMWLAGMVCYRRSSSRP